MEAASVAASVFQGTGFVEFRCDCGATFADNLYNAISHVATWHCDSRRSQDPEYFEGRLATLISPNPLDFLNED